MNDRGALSFEKPEPQEGVVAAIQLCTASARRDAAPTRFSQTLPPRLRLAITNPNTANFLTVLILLFFLKGLFSPWALLCGQRGLFLDECWKVLRRSLLPVSALTRLAVGLGPPSVRDAAAP